MPGIKGMKGKGLGGKREGAGRKPGSTKLRNGQRVGLWENTPEGPVLRTKEEGLGYIVIEKRGSFVIQLDNGDTFTIITN